MSALRELLGEVRDNADASTWSRGVQMARAEAVLGERDDGDEIVLKVLDEGQRVSPTVSLYVEDVEWACTCKTGRDPCEHVAAAVIALNQARKAGGALPKPQQRKRTRLRYKLVRLRAADGEAQRLSLERVFVDERDGGEAPLKSSLTAIVTGKAGGPSVVVTDADMKVEAALGQRATPWIPRPRVELVLAALAECSDVLLDGETARVDARAATPTVVVSDASGGGFALTLSFGDAEAASEIFENGAMVVDQVVRPLGELPLSPSEQQRLAAPGGWRFERESVGQLVAEVLPEIEARVAVERRTRRLPRAERIAPRAELSLTSSGEQLAVRAMIVYGRSARLDGDQLVTLDPEAPVPIRDAMAERRLLRALDNELSLRPGRTAYFHGGDAVAWVSRLDQPEQRALIARTRGDGARAFRVYDALKPQVRADSQRFELRFSSDADGKPREADPHRVMQAFECGEAIVALLGGGWAPLPVDWLSRHGQRVRDLLAAREDGKSLPPSSRPDLLRLLDALEQPPPPDLAALRALLSADALADPQAAGDADSEAPVIPRAELPADLTAQLRDYQLRGVDWLCFLRDAGMGALLADDMGLGKTLQTLCALRGRALVVAPASVLASWLDEAARFRPGLRAVAYHGARRQLDAEADLTVTTYGVLRADAEKLAAVRWGTVVLDESQVIKNPESQVAQAAYGLDARFRVALTGTPVENRLSDLWSQMHVLNRGLLGGRQSFDERYAQPIAAGDARTAGYLRQRIRPFILRRLKRDVAKELPPRTDTVLRCELSAEERAVYDAVYQATRADIVARLAEGDGRGNVMAALEALLRLRQAACHGALVPGQQRVERSSKLQLLVETLVELREAGHKALVFSQWTSLLDLVQPELEDNALRFCRLDGSTRDRAAVVSDFQRPAGPDVMLISLRAGGVGLTLTEADHVFLLDPWWNPAVEDQAADRAHRIGQTRPVMVHRLIAEDTVEERILALQADKRALAAAALEGGAGAVGLSRDDLLALLA